jgi:ubiquinone/menaquinone biosynthesis C-methylase UbiE
MSLETDYSEVIERFSGFANFYDRFRPDPPDDWCDLLIQLAPVERLERVVDLGCGTGRSTRCWVDRAAHVIGVDPSADMLHEAQAQTRSPNVDYRLGFGHQTGLPDQSADIVTCCESLHWMEPGPTFDEIARLLRPGGVFAWLHYSSEPVITPWEVDRAYINFLRRSEALDDALHVTSAVLRWTRAEYVQCMEVNFHYVRQLQLHHVAWGDAAHLVGWVLTQGHVQSLLKRGVSEAEMGLDVLRAEARRVLGDTPRPWYWSADVKIGVAAP